VNARDWMSWPVHHVLIAAYPILYLVSINVGEVDPGEALVPLAISVGAALGLFFVLRVARVSARRAAIVVSIVAVVILMFGQWASAIQPLGISGLPLLASWVLIGAALIALVSVVRSDLRGVTMVLNIGSAILVVLTLMGVGADLVTAPTAFVGGQRVDVDGSTAPTPVPEALPGSPPRDIYYLMVEDHGAPRTLEEYLDIPDSGLMDWLEGAGFEVLRETRSNYGRTPLSVASQMNMTYLDELAAELGPDNPHHGPLREMVKDAEATRFLKERGYAYVLLGSQYDLTAKSQIADVNPTFAETSDFIGVLTESTILPSAADLIGLEDDFTNRRRNYDAAMWDLETFPELAELPGPKFVFMHLFLPHEPWIVDGEGGYVTEEADAERSPTERYRTQWAFVDREMKELIAGLLTGPEETRPIIILTTDEGPNTPDMRSVGDNIDWAGASDAELDLKFAIFTAYYLPGLSETCIYPGMSSVNTFRLVFDLYFDAGLPLLSDRSFIHRDRSHPYDLTDVTDRLPSSGAGSETETACDG
jgi:hypothetical protein